MFDFSVFSTLEGWVSLLSLAAMEIVLGIDNIVFISILTSKLPTDQQPKARSLDIAFPRGWLDSRPLTAADLENEIEYLKGANFRLRVS